jgi:cell division protein FtsI (penicillin-binding protein 3)
VLRDGRGIPSYLDKRYERRGIDQKGVYLTLDRRMQDAVEQELDRSMEETGAAAAMAVVMDPATGEIFALGQRPTFDPNRANHFPPESLANRLISRLYEPGSTMKVLFSSIAIERGILTAQSPIDCQDGRLSIGKKTIGEAESNARYGSIPLEKVIRFSSNIGAIKVVRALGTPLVRWVLNTFGLTTKTGIRLPGEVSSTPRPDDFWTPLHLATAGFGQGISVTPLQMVTAYAPFANGGFLVKPRILMDETPRPDERKRVLSAETVKGMRSILTSVTEQTGGTGLLARVPDVRVGGKTGTAQKYDPKLGYGAGKYFTSFIGFLPADNPSLLIGVMVDEPKKAFYASQVAAPLFSRIAQRAIQILDRLPKQRIAVGNGAAAPASVHIPAVVDIGEDDWLMPDLKGISMREAIQLLGTRLDHVRISGNGYLTGQTPEPGVPINRKSRVSLLFAPAG